ncbi:MAG: hypothetical protein KAJ49_00360 [Arcobacteraceae bacterium]|nr:hypothetical protein [Arcobacteraceae bacterium]
MRKILIVEDSEIKLANIKRVLDTNDFKYFKEPSKTYYDCWKRITRNKEQISAIILDMAFPKFSHENPYMIAGYDILKRMHFENINIPTIIITGYRTFTVDGIIITFNELIKKIEDDNNSIKNVEIVRYDNTSTDWEVKIKEFIKLRKLK